MNSKLESITQLFDQLYQGHPERSAALQNVLQKINDAFAARPAHLKKRDSEKKQHWFLSNEITGMSLYVDRFCGTLPELKKKLPYFKNLGVNLLHLMPLMQSPANASDGGYAVSDFRKVDERFGTIKDLTEVENKMKEEGMYLMLDIVFNHTSDQHEWALKAKAGDPYFQDYFYMYNDRQVPDQFDQTLPDIFPESAPGNFTYVEECGKWVMTIFHNYQWDLNYSNPLVFAEMLDTVFFYANLGVDILRIDAPAFIWKQVGTTSQNLPQAHTLLRLLKCCVEVATPGMALLGEAIVSPAEIMKYFGTDEFTARECDFAYNATHMALQWDALATGDTRVMLAAQHEILQKPYGTSWISYTRCHDDIGLAYDDQMIREAGYDAWEHRNFLKNYYSGIYPDSPAKGALFSVNPKTQDARISGSLASLCGLEKALAENNTDMVDIVIRKILMMQAHSFFIGGIPMIFYGDETGSTNDYSFMDDPAKYYDNRWMHRPVIDWDKISQIEKTGSVEQRIYSGTQRLISIRRSLSLLGDHKNLTWLPPHNKHIAGFLRTLEGRKLYCIFNFSPYTTGLTWYAFKQHGPVTERLFDHWTGLYFRTGHDHEHLLAEPYSFHLLEPVI